MEIRTLKAAQLKPADYNPRRDLQPEDAEYQKLRRSMEEFGYVEPIIWNERTGRVVGGHQRLKVLLEKGAEEIEAVVVDLDERDEKILNVLLNKVKGRWDIGKLADLLQELDEAGAMDLTGFEDWELQSLLMQYDHIKDLMEEDFSGYDDAKERSTFTMTFSLPAGARETVEKYGKNVKRVHLISTAYDRQEKVKATLRRFGVEREFIYHDLFHTPGFVYEKQQKMRIGGVKLHPQYEAKTMKYLVEHDLNTENALFWIVGAEPRERQRRGGHGKMD